MRVISLNLNGIRAAAKKGFFEWLARRRADVVCLQETRAQVSQLSPELVRPRRRHAYFNDAEKKGYAGVALYSRLPPDRVRRGLGWDSADREGRYVQADYGALSVASIYLPSGSSGEERQAIKFDFLERLKPVLSRLCRDGRSYILCGDWNIAHRQVDLENWRANQKNSGFLPQERAWMDWLYDELGMVDAFRVLNQEPRQYTWWSNRGRAWEKNVGWRIDYQVITPDLQESRAQGGYLQGAALLRPCPANHRLRPRPVRRARRAGGGRLSARRTGART